MKKIWQSDRNTKPHGSLNDFFLIDVQEMRFRNLTVRRYHPRIQMKSIVQYKSELDSGSAHKSHSVLL